MENQSFALSSSQRGWITPLPTTRHLHARLSAGSSDPIQATSHKGKSRSDGVSAPTTPYTIAAAAAAAGTTASQSAVGASALRGLAAIRARPFVHLLSFGVVHQSLAWVLLPPLYYFFRSTGAATSMLAGPQTAWILSRPVPSWLPVPGLSLDANPEGGEGNARGKQAKREPTVEDVLEQVIRRAARFSWTASRALYGQARSLESDWNRIKGGELPASIGAKSQPDEVADEAVRALKGQDQSGEGKAGWNIPDLGFSDRVRKSAGEVRIREVVDGVAAYVVVKVSLPAITKLLHHRTLPIFGPNPMLTLRRFRTHSISLSSIGPFPPSSSPVPFPHTQGRSHPYAPLFALLRAQLLSIYVWCWPDTRRHANRKAVKVVA